MPNDVLTSDRRTSSLPARLRPAAPLIVTVLLLVAVTLAAMNNQNNLLFWFSGMIASALVLSILLSHWTMRNLEVKRLDPKHGVVGEPLLLHYAVTNRSRFLPAFNLLIEESERRAPSNLRRFAEPARAWVMHVGPGETVHGEAVVWPRARGEIHFGALRIWTTFPFGIVRRSRTSIQATHTLVYPRRYVLRRGVIDSIMPAGPQGMKLSARPGGGDDYFGLREYKPGDSRRQIAWKRSAGSDALVIRERTLPSPPRLRIVLNLSRSTDSMTIDPGIEANARALEEQAISLAASLIDGAARQGYEVGLSVLGFDLPVTPLQRNQWHIRKIMAALASIELDAGRTRTVARTLADAERAGIVVVHPGRVEPRAVGRDAWHFSAQHLEHLVEGFAAAASGSRPTPNGRAGVTAMAPGREVAA